MASKEAVGPPGYRELRCRTLDVIRDLSTPASNGDIDTAVADAFDLTPEQRTLPHGEGAQTELAYRVAWARTEYLKKIEKVNGPTSACQGSDDGDESAPEDWRQELIDQLLAMSPAAFERLAGRLLEAAGFDEVQVTGKVADGGIDAVGVYRPSGLISFRTSVQCKRWQGSVGRDRVQAFQGASMPKSDRGIIITTGTFTADAKAQAQAPGAFPVDLIDGAQLAELLKQYELGVRTTTVELVTLDQGYFAEYEGAL